MCCKLNLSNTDQYKADTKLKVLVKSNVRFNYFNFLAFMFLPNVNNVNVMLFEVVKAKCLTT